MQNKTTEEVVSMLKDYSAKKLRISVLRYELEHPANISLDDVIDSMSFAKGTGERRSVGHVSNKTMYIALNYRQDAAALNAATSDEIMTELLRLENETARLDFYIGLLEKQHRDAVRLFYMDGLPLQQVAEALSTSVWSVRKMRHEAVALLAEMYGYIQQGSGE